MPKLKDWSVVGGHLVGAVYEHDEFEDGERIVTTRLQRIDFEGRFAVTKSGTVYVLGVPAVTEPTVFAARSEEESK